MNYRKGTLIVQRDFSLKKFRGEAQFGDRKQVRLLAILIFNSSSRLVTCFWQPAGFLFLQDSHFLHQSTLFLFLFNSHIRSLLKFCPLFSAISFSSVHRTWNEQLKWWQTFRENISPCARHVPYIISVDPLNSLQRKLHLLKIRELSPKEVKPTCPLGLGPKPLNAKSETVPWAHYPKLRYHTCNA